MSDDIKPALTPRQWANLKTDLRRVAPAEELFGDWMEFFVEPDRLLINDGIPMAAKPDAGGLEIVPRRHWHALAALCLHEQPFGFTRDDVAMIRGEAADRGVHGAEWSNLADRIEALLPPASSQSVVEK